MDRFRVFSWRLNNVKKRIYANSNNFSLFETVDRNIISVMLFENLRMKF